MNLVESQKAVAVKTKLHDDTMTYWPYRRGKSSDTKQYHDASATVNANMLTVPQRSSHLPHLQPPRRDHYPPEKQQLISFVIKG